MKQILIINGSPHGDRGNCALWAKRIQKQRIPNIKMKTVHLSKMSYGPALKAEILKSDAYVFLTGTYWDSWGSPLQKLLEDMTELEGAEQLVGKPAAVFVLMHSVGGKGVLSRLQGVLSTYGLLIPPMSGMVYSRVSSLVPKVKGSFAKDLWQLEDVDLVLENLKLAMDAKIPWKVWPVDKKDPRQKWISFKQS